MNYYITTSIPYVNGEPHIGHALELVMADTLARYARSKGKPVIFSTGTDEHGSKVAEKAVAKGLTPKQFTDQISQSFRELCSLLNISNDRFIRTTDKGHVQRAQLIWKAISDDIYKGTYKGQYCTGCESFVTEAVAKENNGICPAHNKAYETLEEENYFFRLSKYADRIKQAIIDGSFLIIPSTRKRELLSTIKNGLEDISISRPKSKVSWGIPVPDDKNQVMYVWFEALNNYLTVLGYPEHDDFKKFWPANVQIIGKDILRFHGVIWPGILLALGIPLPRLLFVHGFINLQNNVKMSKSLGNVVDPRQIIERYGADTLRYFLLRHIPSYDDGEFDWKRLKEVYNSELANELGNTVQRTAAMITQYQNGIIGNIPPATHDIAQYTEALEKCRFDKALEEVWELIRGLNRYIEEQKPWEIAKNGETDHLREILAYQVSCILQVSELLQPFMPTTTLKIRHMFEEGIVHPINGTLFPRDDTNLE